MALGTSEDLPAEGAAARGRRPLASKLVASLRQRIIQWEYPPGHRLTEDSLCREFGVSRSPVREALKVLSANGFVEQQPRWGYVVRQLDLREIEELYELRLALEQFVVDQLARREAPDAGLAGLRQSWRELADGPPRSSDELARLDEAFHEGLARGLGNRALLAQLRAINERLLIFRTIDFESPERTGSTCVQHLEVLDRIAAGDPEGARAAIKRNIDDGCAIVETAIGNALARAFAGRPRGTARGNI